MDLRHFLRWMTVMPQIVWRSDGLVNRLKVAHCLARSVAAHTGIHLDSREIEIRLDGNIYYVDTSRRDLTPYASVWIEHEYEPDSRFLPPHDGVVVDIGAQVGFLTTRMARHVTSGRVIAVEPDPLSFRRLQKGVIANGLHNVTLAQCALSNKEGTSAFVSAPHSVDSRLLSRDRIPRRLMADPGTQTTEVACTTLDRLMERERVDAISLLKVDVEGAELEVLDAAKQTLLLVASVLIEIHDPKSIGTITELLHIAGLNAAHQAGNVHGFLRSGS